MPKILPRLIPLGSLLLALGAGGCGPDERTGPSAAPTGTTASAVTWIVRDLGTLGGPHSQANAINSAGVIVGTSNIPGSDKPHAFVWRRGVMSDLGALAGGWSEATAMNEDGVIVGWSTTAAGNKRAVRWKDGVKRNLGTLGGRNSEARAINVFGHIVGWSETASGVRHAFLWKDGVMKDLGTLGRQFSFGVAINTRGQIVGNLGPTLDAAGEELEWLSPFIYGQEVMRHLGVAAGRVSVEARAISAEGLVVGQGFDTGDEPGEERAWWWENGASGRLPPLDPTIQLDNHAGAFGVNRAGTVVGFSKTSSGQSHAVLWRRP